MFKDRIALDPHLSKDTTKMPYKKLVECLAYLGHVSFQDSDAPPNTDELDCIYYSPFAPFVMKTDVRSLFRFYEPSAQRCLLANRRLALKGRTAKAQKGQQKVTQDKSFDEAHVEASTVRTEMPSYPSYVRWIVSGSCVPF